MKTKCILYLATYWKTKTKEGINEYFMDLKNNYVAQSPCPYYLENRVTRIKKLIPAIEKGTFRGHFTTLPIIYLSRKEKSFERQQIFNLA